AAIGGKRFEPVRKMPPAPLASPDGLEERGLLRGVAQEPDHYRFEAAELSLQLGLGQEARLSNTRSPFEPKERSLAQGSVAQGLLDRLELIVSPDRDISRLGQDGRCPRFPQGR